MKATLKLSWLELKEFVFVFIIKHFSDNPLFQDN